MKYYALLWIAGLVAFAVVWTLVARIVTAVIS